MSSVSSSLRPPLEARTLPRVGADFPVEVFVSGGDTALLGRTRDLGIGGLCVATPEEFEFKTIDRVIVTLPSGPLELQAAGRWQRGVPGEEIILTGVDFPNTPEDVASLLWDFVLDRGKILARFLYTKSDLRDFGIEDAMGLAQITRIRSVSAGGLIYGQDSRDPGEDSIFMVYRGTVTLQMRGSANQDTPFDRLDAGRIFGGLPLFAAVGNAESAIAEDEVRLLEIDRSAYTYLCTAKPWLAQRLAQAVTAAYARRAHDLLVHLRSAI